MSSNSSSSGLPAIVGSTYGMCVLAMEQLAAWFRPELLTPWLSMMLVVSGLIGTWIGIYKSLKK